MFACSRVEKISYSYKQKMCKRELFNKGKIRFENKSLEFKKSEKTKVWSLEMGKIFKNYFSNALSRHRR